MITDIRETDNRTHEDIIGYYEARIEALSRRVHELEKELAKEREDCLEMADSISRNLTNALML